MVPPFVANMLMQAEYLAKLIATAKEEDARKEIKARGLRDGDSETTKGKKKRRRVLDERDGDDWKRSKGLEMEKKDNNPEENDATPPPLPSPVSNPPQNDGTDPLSPDASPFDNSTMTAQTLTTYVTVWKTVQPTPASSSTPVVTSTVYVPIYVTATVAPSSSIEPTTSTSELAATSQSTAVQDPTSVTSVSPTSTTTSISRTSFQRYTGTSRASRLNSLSTSPSSSETASTSLASLVAAPSSSITTSAISSPPASSSQASSSQVLTSQPSTTQSSTSQLSSSQATSSNKDPRTTFERFQASCTSGLTSCTVSSIISSSISGGASITTTAVADTASSTATSTAASKSLDQGIGTTLVVFAGLGGAALVFFGIWACIKRRIYGVNVLKDPKDENEKDLKAFSGAGRAELDNENRLWGPTSTGAGIEPTRRSRGPLEMAVHIPPTMPRSPAYDLYQARQQAAQTGSEILSDNEPYGPLEGQIQPQEIYFAGSSALNSPQYPQNFQPVSPSMQIVGAHDPYRRPHPSPRAYGGEGGYYEPVELPAEGVNLTRLYSGYTDVQPQSQWSYSRDSSTTVSTVPRFRDVESWASDQRLRSEGGWGGQGGGQGGGGLGGPLGDGVGGGGGVGVGPAGSGLRNVI